MQTMISALASAISDLPGARFASFVYTSVKSGEVARVLMILGADTRKLYARDVAQLQAMIPTLSGLRLEAATAILASRQESLNVGIGNNEAYTCADTYVYPAGFDNGIRIHKETGDVYVTGLVQHKTILTPGDHKPVNSRPLTLAKKEIERSLPSGSFRLYKLGQVGTAKVNGETLEVTGN